MDKGPWVAETKRYIEDGKGGLRMTGYVSRPMRVEDVHPKMRREEWGGRKPRREVVRDTTPSSGLNIVEVMAQRSSPVGEEAEFV